MSDQYRLVYAGEVLEGQHPAVVRKRLAAVLKLSDERMDVLFSGKPVVVKKAIDPTNAERYQAVFEKAGAQLRVLPVGSAGQEATPSADPAQTTPPKDAALQVLPLGADVLSDDERSTVPEADIDTSHLTVQGAVFHVDEPNEEVSGPNVDHLTLAEVGAQLSDTDASDLIVAEIDVDFSVAEVGAILGDLDAEPSAPAVDVERVDFEVAELGSDLNTIEKPPPPPAPDTSHLQVDDPVERE